MDASRYRELMQLFDAAVDLPAVDQGAFVARIGERDIQLERKLRLKVERNG